MALGPSAILRPLICLDTDPKAQKLVGYQEFQASCQFYKHEADCDQLKRRVIAAVVIFSSHFSLCVKCL